MCRTGGERGRHRTGPTTADPVAAGPGSGAGTVNKGDSRRNGSVPTRNQATTKPPPKITATPTRKAVPARLGDATVPRGATYIVSGDRQAFAVGYSTLVAGTAPYPPSKSLSTTVPVTGDTQRAVLELSVSGYTVIDESTTAKLTITANGRTMARSFRTGTDDDYVHTFAVPLRGARQCGITLEVEVNPNPQVRDPSGVINVLSLDAQFV